MADERKTVAEIIAEMRKDLAVDEEDAALFAPYVSKQKKKPVKKSAKKPAKKAKSKKKPVKKKTAKKKAVEKKPAKKKTMKKKKR